MTRYLEDPHPKLSPPIMTLYSVFIGPFVDEFPPLRRKADHGVASQLLVLLGFRRHQSKVLGGSDLVRVNVVPHNKAAPVDHPAPARVCTLSLCQNFGLIRQGPRPAAAGNDNPLPCALARNLSLEPQTAVLMEAKQGSEMQRERAAQGEQWELEVVAGCASTDAAIAGEASKWRWRNPN